jgi:hypothetical protein
MFQQFSTQFHFNLALSFWKEYLVEEIKKKELNEEMQHLLKYK